MNNEEVEKFLAIAEEMPVPDSMDRISDEVLDGLPLATDEQFQRLVNEEAAYEKLDAEFASVKNRRNGEA